MPHIAVGNILAQASKTNQGPVTSLYSLKPSLGVWSFDQLANRMEFGH